MKNEPVIAISNLNHYYGKGALKKQILFDINLEIYPGEIVIMTGPSGSGKTTLLSLIGGLRSVQEGSLKFLGVELSGANQSKLVQIRRSIGYIFQAHNLLGFLTAKQNVQMAVELNEHISQAEAIAQSQAMLTAVGLENRVEYYPDNMSGGQKQRIAIARALVNNPPLVLADEPTAALDKQSGRDVVEIMQRLAKDQGTSILLVTHDNRILDIADRIVEMEDGILARDSQTAIISYEAGAWSEKP
ncbi:MULTISPECIES: DevA family ABC transporter ATP-binding protein [unclassified Anabaena]|uniref:DevA family ABC transporter ATP-binding protein n=1 Tax=unclassified Anabaena TaxID=2619674 RepID=UPI0016895649|nr:DevA family ABC transporter ATP-binding protein [Anabaena sp. UHCC 0399]MBD2360059.1 DevA family ABC transporter ATP-binding protein [Anabaena minutissima FACHB-250]MEA5565105.1 DevA family ABC transporter ATP-binding protein [Anabaena sp. UHCC 0399]